MRNVTDVSERIRTEADVASNEEKERQVVDGTD
jgi:hypothetical protein